MTIRFRNPWVDPRILDVRPADAEAYLRNHGWQETESGSPHRKRFRSPAIGDPEAVLLPGDVNDEALLNLLIECIGKIAAWEGRYAGDVVSALLVNTTGEHANGVPPPQKELRG